MFLESSSSFSNCIVTARKYKLHCLSVLCLLLFGLPSVSFGQNATIVGTVTDPSGGVMPNVNITVTNTETGWTRTIPTNDSGQYVVPNIQIGRYNVKAEASGFKVAEQKDVVRSEEHTSELQSLAYLVCRLLLEKKKKRN